MNEAESPSLDRVSFLLGYLLARTDSAAEILELVSEGEALLDGEREIAEVLPEIEALEPPAKRPAPATKKPAKHAAGKKTNKEQIIERYRLGHRPMHIAVALDLSKKYVGVTLTQARKRGDLPPVGSSEDQAIKLLDPKPVPRDVTADLMGDPAPGRSAADTKDGVA